jgi:alpha-galactosidase
MNGSRPTIFFQAGNLVYAESFEHGRLLSQGWSHTGKVPEPAPPDAMRDHPADSFGLVVDGRDLRRGWQWEGETQLDEHHHLLGLHHPDPAVRLTVHTVTAGSGFLERWLDIENAGPTPFSITQAWCLSGILLRNLESPDLTKAESEFEIGRFLYRAWHTEGRFAWEPLGFDTLCLESTRGTSGWGPPFFLLRRTATGETFLVGLACSSNWRMEVNHDPLFRYSCLSFRAGPWGPPPLRVVGPGERIETPRVHIGFHRGALDEVVQAWHDYLRAHVMPDRYPTPFPPVSYNHWSTLKDQFEEKQILAEIDKAAEVGAEMFVLDAGWFGRARDQYPANCGDWIPGPCFPNGLAPVVDRIHGHGMKFSLWVAFWMLGNKCAVIEEHPEWLIEIEGRRYFADITEEGHPGFFMNLDLAHPDALAWIEGELDRIVSEYRVDMLRLDGGPTSYEGGFRDVHGYRENSLWLQNENFYGLLDRLRTKHPHLLVDNCAGGGGRLDYGMLSRSEIAFISDDFDDQHSMIRTLNGVTLALPPEICTRTFGTILPETDDLAFALRVPLFGQYCVSGLEDAWRDASTTEYAMIRRHLDIYKNFLRRFFPACRVFHHTPVLVGPQRAQWCVLEYAAADQSRALVGLFRLDAEAPREITCRPRGLRPDRRYRVKWDSAQADAERDGSALIEEGVRVRAPAPGNSELLLIESDSPPGVA